MHLIFSSPPGARLRQLLVLLLLALGLLAGVSVSQTRELEAQVANADAVVLPALKRVHELASRVDDLHGMAALHLTMRNEAERTELEGRLQASRLQIERRMANFSQRLTDETDRRHHQQVVASLVVFWAAQDRLLVVSRRAATDPAAAEQARALLAGATQQAFHRLRADIGAWWAHTEQAAEQAARQARAAAHLATLVVWAQAALAALALAMAWALLRLPRRPLPPVAAAAALDSSAAQAHLQALNAAVGAARRGEPGRAAGLSAQEAQHLAEQVEHAARGLRRLIDRPQAATSAAGPDSLPPGPPDGAPAPRR